jgi:serine/threonine protein kinase
MKYGRLAARGFIVYSLAEVTSTTSPTERVGRYQLLEPIGIGPSGAVSRAKVFGVAGFERQFAVKRFHAELTTTAAMAAMLSAAARAYGSLEHPRIARMSEFGVAQGTTFTAVEYVVGLDALRMIGEARLAGVTLAAGGALSLVSQAARTVGYAHGRGLTHLGLAPTNVIVTAEGDIKITDFGVLSATLPQRPIETPRLAQRIAYLAPEQLANEATSAATDVFALGVLAYELVTGNRAFKGDTPQQIASAIMAGPPPEPPLPRPIVRVLSRCLARSPFERFPDARALADALDAALRVAPVPGTRKDIGAQVKETLERLAALNEGQMSGVVALHLGTGPTRRIEDDDARRSAPALGKSPEPTRDPEEKMTLELARPAPQSGGPVTVVGGPATIGGPTPSGPVTINPATTVEDLPRFPITTMAGVPPPPIPVPTIPAIAGAGSPVVSSSSAQQIPSTLHGVGKAPPLIPPAPPNPSGPPARPTPRPGSLSGIPSIKPPAVPAAAVRAGTRPGTDLGIPIDPTGEAPRPVTEGDRSSAGEGPRATLARGNPSGTGQAGEASSDSAIHTLDPSDLVPIDSGLINIVELDALADNAAGETGTSAIAASATPPAKAAGSSAETKAPHKQPSLFEPIAQRPTPQPPSAGNDAAILDRRSPIAGGGAPNDFAGPTGISSGQGGAGPLPRARSIALGHGAEVLPHGIDEDHAFDADDTPDGLARSQRGGAASTDIAISSAQTVLGVGAPLPLPRATTPAPHPQIPAAAADTATQEAPNSGLQIPPAQPYETPSAESQPPEAPSTAPLVQPPFAPELPPGWVATPPTTTPPDATNPDAERPRRRLRGIVLGLMGAAIAGIAAWQIYLRVAAPPATRYDGSGSVAENPSDAALAVAPSSDAAQVAIAAPADATQGSAPSIDAAQVAVAPLADAAQTATTSDDASNVATANPAAGSAGTTPSDATLSPVDAAQVAQGKPGASSATGDTLAIASTPPGARVFLDGSDTGTTPLKLPGSPDRHTIAVLLAGHELYVAQVDGHGTFQIPLKEVTPTNGPAGIKVLRCKDKDRYYVFLDGKPTGQTCPTERIGCEVGPHTVEVYDLVSETRRKWDIAVKDTRLSFRVRVE